MPPSANVCVHTHAQSQSHETSLLLPASDDCGKVRVRSSSSRSSLHRLPIMEPTVEKFSLPTTLPKRLADLGVNIAVQQTSVVLQYSMHLCPRQMKRELRLVFPSLSGKENDLLIIPTFQKTKSSMISYDAETQIEKDEKLELFYRWGTELIERLHEEGFWADITDPMSGAALFSTSGPSLYPDVESAEILLRYRPFNLGSCFVMSHPNWGTHVYPATAFTLAPADVVARVLADMQAGSPPAR